MFTGIVEQTGIVASLTALSAGRNGPAVRRLEIEAAGFFAELREGASVAVNGVCLTLVDKADGNGRFDIVVETLDRTNLGELHSGEPVNLVRSMRAGDRIDGHFVQGHVEAVVRLLRIDRHRGEYKLWLENRPEIRPFVVPKGSVTLDGVSLTIVDANATEFSVVLIPVTLERTTLGRRREGDRINVETDIVTRVVAHQLQGLGLATTSSAASLADRAGREQAQTSLVEPSR